MVPAGSDPPSGSSYDITVCDREISSQVPVAQSAKLLEQHPDTRANLRSETKRVVPDNSQSLLKIELRHAQNCSQEKAEGNPPTNKLSCRHRHHQIGRSISSQESWIIFLRN
jgi:hypothetical protein